jgi:hypothetical protein
MTMNALEQARVHKDEYQRRINLDTGADTILYENRVYKQCMMQAAIAQAEALERIASILALHNGP